MVEKNRSGKKHSAGKRQPMGKKDGSGQKGRSGSGKSGAKPAEETPGIEGLSASLEALTSASLTSPSAEVGGRKKRTEQNKQLPNRSKGPASDIIHLALRKEKERQEAVRSARKLAHGWDKVSGDKQISDRRKHDSKTDEASEGAKLTGDNENLSKLPPEKQGPEIQETEKQGGEKKGTEQQGIVELLGALKSDIDSLRKDNEEFKTRLMSAPLAAGGAGAGNGGDSGDMRALLEALKADMGNLRRENEQLRAQALSAEYQPRPDLPTGEEDELFQMLGELKEDIVSLRSENEALRHGAPVPPLRTEGAKGSEVAKILHELKDDITTLKQDNEALRLESLTARDGAHFENLGGQHDAYRNSGKGIGGRFAKAVAALVLFAGAAGGGYYLALSQTGNEGGISAPQQVALNSGEPTRGPTPLTKPETATEAKPVAAPVVNTTALPEPVNQPQPVSEKAPPPPPAPTPTPTLGTDVEIAMLARAQGLLENGDLGAARMVFVYLSRHGSGEALHRLARTYDPQYLAEQQFEADKYADAERARRLYGVAAGMGNENASARLQELQ